MRERIKRGKDTGPRNKEIQHRRSRKNSHDGEVKIRMKENPRTTAMQ